MARKKVLEYLYKEPKNVPVLADTVKDSRNQDDFQGRARKFMEDGEAKVIGNFRVSKITGGTFHGLFALEYKSRNDVKYRIIKDGDLLNEIVDEIRALVVDSMENFGNETLHGNGAGNTEKAS